MIDFFLALAQWAREPEHQGTLPAYLALAVALLVGIPAFRSARNSRSQLDALLEDREREAEERRMEQASKVAAYFMVSSERDLAFLDATNANDIAIYDFRVYVVKEDGSEVLVAGMTTFRPTPRVGHDEKSTAMASMYPESLQIPARLGLNEAEVAAKVRRGDLRLAITFRDSAGVTWRRDRDGRLSEIAERDDEPS